MGSKALDELAVALTEVRHLQLANPSPEKGGGLTRSEIARAMGRAETVLLCSHFERFLYRLVAEATQFVLSCDLAGSALPEELRLQHARPAIQELAETSWENRGSKLLDYSSRHWQLWSTSEPVATLDADALLLWMKTPDSKSVGRLFRLWGIPDIFSLITRSPTIRQDLWLNIKELSEKRNGIAHGDSTVEASYLDVRRYQAAVVTFATRSDSALARRLADISGVSRPW